MTVNGQPKFHYGIYFDITQSDCTGGVTTVQKTLFIFAAYCRTPAADGDLHRGLSSIPSDRTVSTDPHLSPPDPLDNDQ